MKKFHNLICYLMLLTMLLLCMGCGKEENTDVKSDDVSATEQLAGESADEDAQKQMTEDAEEQMTEVAEAEALAFPVMLDSDRLELTSVFEYAGINPDSENIYAENIGAIQMKNVSGQYLKSVEILVSLSNGETMRFLVEDIPADMEVLAFDTQNQSYDDSIKVIEVVAEAEYESVSFEESFSSSISGSDITVENVSGKNQNNIRVYYHCTIDGLCFGGQSYELSLESLDSGASGTVSDTECYMGDVTVTNIVAE